MGLGMQLAVVEFARNVLGLEGANSTEFDPATEHPVVALLTEWKDRGNKVQRSMHSDLGGTMRKGAQECPVKAGTHAHSIYGDNVNERHRHRYEVNNGYISKMEEGGLVISARTQSENLTEVVELPNHPLFTSFIQAVIKRKHMSTEMGGG